MTPRFNTKDTCLLYSERGVTLLEVLVTTLVLALMVVTVYIGIEYAEKMSVQNYRKRKAIMVASGELERQYFVNKYNGRQDQEYFQVFSNREFILDYVKKDIPLLARLSVSRARNTEFNGADQYVYNAIVTTVEWIDPASHKPVEVRLREDYYLKMGN
ncbi:MAG: prepilin-type N-terminal cleavage/methylation domain-containing protein [Candidatus Cloacimonetes bacterium]|nr:prepilin-type N-terminal cleavage/methylation domain-containing protein [Candidatus Cloacimonadota bacterium]